jgi:hypothetical protein
VKIKIHSECLFLVLTLFAIPLSSQKGLDEPPAKLEVAKHPLILERPIGPQPQKINFAQLQQDAFDLAQIAHSITNDVDQEAQGKLAKDLPEKLKRIEKLSKHLRNQITP